jgi:hypothetical protein
MNDLYRKDLAEFMVRNGDILPLEIWLQAILVETTGNRLRLFSGSDVMFLDPGYLCT